MKRLRSCWAPYVSAHVKRTWSRTVLSVAMATALWSVARAGRRRSTMVLVWLTSLIPGYPSRLRSRLCVAGVKKGESERCASVTERSRVRRLTRTSVAAIMHLKCAADAESAFVGSVFVARAAKSPSTRTTASSVSAVISAVISTEDNSAEVRHKNHS